MTTNEPRDKRAEARRPSSSTSPPGGRIDRATKPPTRGNADRKAVERGWAALDLAAGGH
jgi:hypothetical protein